MEMIKVNGVHLHYKYIDTQKDKTFVFINSLGTDFRIWADAVTVLKAYGNILLQDKRGHGLSDYTTSIKGLNDFAKDTMALLNHLQIKKSILIGLSVGGMIAQIIAHQQAALIEQLILCDTRFKIGNDQIWNERITMVKEKGLTAISDGVLQRWFSDRYRNENPARVSGYKNMLERTPVWGYIKTCEAIRDADLTECASQIKIPTLCIVGSEDKSTTPEEVKNLADLVIGSKYKLIEGSGHLPCIDNPATFCKLIIEFIKK